MSASSNSGRVEGKPNRGDGKGKLFPLRNPGHRQLGESWTDDIFQSFTFQNESLDPPDGNLWSLGQLVAGQRHEAAGRDDRLDTRRHRALRRAERFAIPRRRRMRQPSSPIAPPPQYRSSTVSSPFRWSFSNATPYNFSTWREFVWKNESARIRNLVPITISSIYPGP